MHRKPATNMDGCQSGVHDTIPTVLKSASKAILFSLFTSTPYVKYDSFYNQNNTWQ